MSRVAVERAAKRAGFTIIRAEYHWMPHPGEMVPEWEVVFHPADDAFDHEVKYFANSSEAIQFFGDAARVLP